MLRKGGKSSRNTNYEKFCRHIYNYGISTMMTSVESSIIISVEKFPEFSRITSPLDSLFESFLLQAQIPQSNKSINDK